MSDRPRIGPQLHVSQTQRLALNATLGASIQLLRTDAAGLTKYLEEQTASNPHLRLEAPPAPGLHDWLPRWGGIFHTGGMPAPADQIAGSAPGLIAHVTAAVDGLRLSAQDRRIAQALIEALEPSGWIGQPLPMLAADIRVSVPDAGSVLARLQTIDPAGLFARTLAECLSLQAAEIGVLDAPMQILLSRLDLLASGDITRLARLCAVDEAGIMARFRAIRAMNPKPGADFAPLAAASVREPDLVVRAAAGGGWNVGLNRSALPDLQVEPAGNGSSEQLTAARALHRMVSARNATLLSVAAEIMARQRPALDHGPTAIVPMTMADLAGALGLHKSTISRVVAGASIDTPKGTWWLRTLFSGAMGGDAMGGGAAPVMSGAALRHLLAQLIGAENSGAPLSDAALASRLTAETGVPIARRTVTKYREDQGIPAASRRKRKMPQNFPTGSGAKTRTKG